MSESIDNSGEPPIPAKLVPDADRSSDSRSAADHGDSPNPPVAPGCDDRPTSLPLDWFDSTEEESPAPLPPASRQRPAPVNPAERHRRMVGAEHVQPRRRRIGLPIVLFLLTCFSTFWAWCGQAQPDLVLRWLFPGRVDPAEISADIRLHVLEHWQGGLIYMGCVLAILFAHEMGHFLMTLRYRIAASLPYFLPVPFTPIGTMGAVISMDGLSADRRQIFDIGIAGPLAGLVVAIPITWYGVEQLDLSNYNMTRLAEEHDGFAYDMPWMVSMMVESAQPEGYRPGQRFEAVPTDMMNPFLMAGWVGLLITGLNMMPISQLDGGHVIYGLFGKRAHVIARISLFAAIFMVVIHFDRVYFWMVMLLLVTLLGTDHPPTANDRVPLGAARTVLGWVSLSIPFLCFPFFGLWQLS